MRNNFNQRVFFMSKKQWRDRHFNDPFVKQAHKEGYVCRAAYKILDIHQRYKVFKPGMSVVDLGAAPGGWSQAVTQLIGENGKVVGIDLLPLNTPLAIDFIQGDFTEQACFDEIVVKSGGSVDVVMSDMAPNLSGNKTVDQIRSIQLVESALFLASKILQSHGFFIAKVFNGAGFDELIGAIRQEYTTVKIYKPKSSRSTSSEIFVVATGKRN